MKTAQIRLVVLLAAVAVLGIIITQIFWVRKAFDLEDQQFNMSVNIALREVAITILAMNGTPEPKVNPVEQISDNYFVVGINSNINARTLETLLRGELEQRGIKTDFEYGIYDCQSDKIVYGNYIRMEKSLLPINPSDSLPKWKNQPYYFGIMFPQKETTMISRMGIWLFTSLVLVFVIAFFVFAMFVIFQQKRLSEVQKDFINNMTHEFKTPISTISISAGVLKQPSIVDNPKRLVNYATIIQNEANRLKNQVERVLQMATIEEEKIKLNLETIDAHEVVSAAVGSVDAVLKESDGTITCKLNATKKLLQGDHLHFTNIIYNLLDNAIKYSQDVPHITISTENYINDQILIKIKDNGIGISKDHLKKVFDKFYRVPTGNVHDVKGFGLGLNYVKIVVAAHHGTIKMDSDIGKGTTVSLLFNAFVPTEA